MALDNSVVYICLAANITACNSAMAAFYGDSPSAQNFSVALCADNVNPVEAIPTAWGGAIWREGADATTLKDWPNGVLPTPEQPWANYGLDDASALAAGEAMNVQVATGPDASPVTNFNSLLVQMGLQKVQGGGA
jgi:hypothetical protein